MEHGTDVLCLRRTASKNGFADFRPGENPGTVVCPDTEKHTESEAENGAIDGSIKPDVNVKPARKK